MASTFAARSKTQAYYQYGVKSLLAYNKLAEEPLDEITSEKIAGFIAKHQPRVAGSPTDVPPRPGVAS